LFLGPGRAANLSWELGENAMRACLNAARAAAILLALLGFAAGSAASAQSGTPLLLVQAISPADANRQGDDAYERKDYAEAMRWYRQAADQGYALGQANVGFLYAKGLGVSQDSAAAVHWYLLAAEQGQIEAQHNLALRYANGDGVKKDLAQARFWMEKSAAGGDADAQNWLREH
jgi:TPR repeat protein